MSDTIFEQNRPIARDLLSSMSSNDAGQLVLQVRAYYHKDARRRGLKLSISRVLKTEWGYAYDLMNKYNGLIHLADMPRKPAPKVAAQWAERIAAQVDAIEKIALASAAPDWSQIATFFAP